ncbi:MAG TPA: hypothetical protein DF698_05995 [Candidatus Atribacteria bacterium]|nr:hypothetical protein [Candidatus Atribacteria bacterium]
MLFDIKKKNADEKEPEFKEYELKYPNPHIFIIDVEKSISDGLAEIGFNVKNGSLGTPVKVPNLKEFQYHRCLSNFSFPSNLHEFEIVVIDLQEKGRLKDYIAGEHQREISVGSKSVYIRSAYPETLFNPKPYGAANLHNDIEAILKKGGLIIVFASISYSIKYHFVNITSRGDQEGVSRDYWIYNFLPIHPNFENKQGEKIKVEDSAGILKPFFKRYFEESSKGAHYEIIFKLRADDEIIPLLKNASDEIVGYYQKYKGGSIIVLPQLEEKNEFLKEFFLNELPSICPFLFPYQTKFQWLEAEPYCLPNEVELLEKRTSIVEDYNHRLREIEKEILENKEKFSCLHGLLTKSGIDLVTDVGTYFSWLGFENVKLMDFEKTGGLLEEDIQIEFDRGLLVIEVKGISGTSKDEECSQINKIKFRRAKERGKFDVFGLYVVNHQKHLPPLERENPPFKENQIRDAINEERSLLSTWQLFNLFFSIKTGAISKEEARTSLLNFGLITFYPTAIQEIGKPVNVLKEGKVILLNTPIPISTSNKIIIKRGDRYLVAKILEMQLHDKIINSIEKGEVGIKIDFDAKKTDVIYIK